MARTSLSLAALGTACGTAADIAACAGNSSVASMEDFAIDSLTGISAETAVMEADGVTTYYFYPTG